MDNARGKRAPLRASPALLPPRGHTRAFLEPTKESREAAAGENRTPRWREGGGCGAQSPQGHAAAPPPRSYSRFLEMTRAAQAHKPSPAAVQRSALKGQTSGRRAEAGSGEGDAGFRSATPVALLSADRGSTVPIYVGPHGLGAPGRDGERGFMF